MSRGWIRICHTFLCPEVELGIRYGLFYFRIILIIIIIIIIITFVVVAAAAVSVAIWRYPIGWTSSIWNARMMQFHILSLVALSVDSRHELVVVCSACRHQIVTSTSRHKG